MTFRCCKCGNLFEDGEQAVWYETHGLDSPPYEKWDGCPVCRGDYEEVHQCKECGDWHSDDELYGGWCEKCLRESISYDMFFDYCEVYKKHLYFDTFVMSELLGGMECPDNVSFEFHQLMVETYKKRVEMAKGNEKACGFLQAITRFVLEDDGSWGKEDYAEWMNKRDGWLKAGCLIEGLMNRKEMKK